MRILSRTPTILLQGGCTLSISRNSAIPRNLHTIHTSYPSSLFLIFNFLLVCRAGPTFSATLAAGNGRVSFPVRVEECSLQKESANKNSSVSAAFSNICPLSTPFSPPFQSRKIGTIDGSIRLCRIKKNMEYIFLHG